MLEMPERLGTEREGLQDYAGDAGETGDREREATRLCWRCRRDWGQRERLQDYAGDAGETGDRERGYRIMLEIPERLGTETERDYKIMLETLKIPKRLEYWIHW
jgi:hypothetical protein